MKLRSGFNKETQSFKLILHKEKVPKKQYKVEIDFDKASKAWRENKTYVGMGMFIYKVN